MKLLALCLLQIPIKIASKIYQATTLLLQLFKNSEGGDFWA